MGLKDIGHSLPPGFGFYPSDEELVCYYLYEKIMNDEVDVTTTLVEIDLHTCEPWQLPDVAKLNSKEWYFFSFRDRKYATGFRTNRATKSGYWKATGKDRAVIDPISKAIVGMRKTLVFYKNRAPNGIKTEWIMHEFRLENPNLPPKEDWVLCRLFHKSISEKDDNQFASQDLSTQACIPNTYAQNFTCIDTSLRHNQHGSHYQNQLKFNQNPGNSVDDIVPYLQLDPSPQGGYGNFGGDHMMNHSNIIGAHQSAGKLMETKSEDGYEFLVDMSFEYSAIINDELHGSIEHENNAVFM